MGYSEGLDPHATAVAELKEEMGITAGCLVELGNYHVAVGCTDQPAFVYLATHLTFGEAKPEPGEFFDYETCSIEEIGELICSGIIKDGPTIVAYQYLTMYRQGHVL